MLILLTAYPFIPVPQKVGERRPPSYLKSVGK